MLLKISICRRNVCFWSLLALLVLLHRARARLGWGQWRLVTCSRWRRCCRNTWASSTCSPSWGRRRCSTGSSHRRTSSTHMWWRYTVFICFHKLQRPFSLVQHLINPLFEHYLCHNVLVLNFEFSVLFRVLVARWPTSLVSTRCRQQWCTTRCTKA